MTLTDFLLARIAEDEASARRLLRYAQENELACKEPQMLGKRLPGWHEWPDVQAMCGRALAECEVKRRLVNEFKSWSPWTLSVLALPHADHPDYQLAWKP